MGYKSAGYLLCALTFVGLSACVSDIVLKHPQTGEIATCKFDSWWHYNWSMLEQFRCEDDYEAKGFIRVRHASETTTP